MMFGEQKHLAVHASDDDFDNWFLRLLKWQPRSGLECAQACRIALAMLKMPGELTADEVFTLALLRHALVALRRRNPEAAALMRQAAHAENRVEGYAKWALAAVGRGAVAHASA